MVTLFDVVPGYVAYAKGYVKVGGTHIIIFQMLLTMTGTDPHE